MKVVTRKAVYLQKRDIKLLISGRVKLPLSILDKIMGIVGDIDYTNKDDYVMFEEPHEIKFINELDWFIDYRIVNNMSIQELNQLYQTTLLEKDGLKIEYDELEDEEEKRKILWQTEIKNHKLETIKSFMWCKDNKETFPLPEDISDQNRPIEGIKPSGFVKNIGRL